MRHLRPLIALAVAASAFVLAPKAAHAEDYSLHLEPGLAIPLTKPQTQLYNPGVGLEAKFMFNLNHNFSIGPSASAMYLPRAEDNGQNAGVLWQFGGSGRLQGDHGAHSSFSPWVDLDAMLANTGNLQRPAFDVAVGFEVPTDHLHQVWTGPGVRYTHMFQTDNHQSGALLDGRDVNVLQVVWSFAFDFPVKRDVHVVNHETVKVVHDDALVIVHEPSQQVVAQAEPFSLTEHVYFDWDKSTLRWESKDKLDAVVAKLNAHKNLTIGVEGHASSDGQVAHNQVLSEKRTDAVVAYLVNHGVDPKRLVGAAHGVDQPAASNTTQEGRERNRRVEFTITFKQQ